MKNTRKRLAAKPSDKLPEDQMKGPFIHEKHDCALFERKESKWQWIEGGTIQRYPKLGEPVIVAYSNIQFSYTKPIIEVISIDESDQNSIDIVFMDTEKVWMLTLPLHSNDVKAIRKSLKKGVVLS